MDEREAWQELTGICAAFPEHERQARMWFERKSRESPIAEVGRAIKSFRRTLDSGELIGHPQAFLDAVMRRQRAFEKIRDDLKKKGLNPGTWWKADGGYGGFRQRKLLEGRAKLMGRPLTEEEEHLTLNPDEGPMTGMPEECEAALRRLGVRVKERSPF